MTQGDCFTPAVRAASAEKAGALALDAHRAVRYEGLLQLIEEVQRKRSIPEVARSVAGLWKHCASVSSWRLLCVYAEHCALVVARNHQATVVELELDALAPFDAVQWRKRLPARLSDAALQAERAALPEELALEQGVDLNIIPVQQGVNTIGILSVLTCDKPFDKLDRKFNALVAGVMAGRILSILTEQSLTADLMGAQRTVMEQRQASIMGRLVNGVAHELNTPLGVQIASCDLLATMVSDSASVQSHAQDIEETVMLIEAQARRAARIVRRLKQISAASASSAKVATFLHEELNLIAQAHPDLDIQTDCPEHLQIALDRLALGTVLGELLDNVRFHSGYCAGDAPVRLSASDNGKRVVIRVIDPGVGFSAQQAEHFYDPFFTSKVNQGHIGIGGYIAQNVARDGLDATLELDSQPGRTVVSLSLPRS